jgi:hypothetical protein
MSLRELAWTQADDPALHDAETDAKIKALSHRDFGNTCFDYIAGIARVGEQYGVTVFIEPAGPVIKVGKSISEILTWWERVFETQPPDLDYTGGQSA